MPSISEGDVDLVITDNDDVAATFNLTTGGLVIIMNTLIKNIEMTANSDSIYDMIVTGTIVEEA